MSKSRAEPTAGVGDAIDEAVAARLVQRDAIVELGAAASEAVCILGVPHHAGPGIDRIAEHRPEGARVADENAVLYALVAQQLLAARGISCRTVVAAHATDHDPNKDASSPYCRALFGSGRPRLLVECHGSGWFTPHPLELSAGANPLGDPLGFGRALAAALGEKGWLAAQKRPGGREALILGDRGESLEESQLKFPALRTASLQLAAEHGVAALHLEAMPRFRTYGVRGMALPDDGAALGRAIAVAVESTLSAGR